MAQTGDPTGTGRGGSGQNLDAEFSLENHKRGVLSMARSQDPNSADSQFFIVFDDSSFLDNQYTVWGEVSDGMDLVDKIKRCAEGSGAVDEAASSPTISRRVEARAIGAACPKVVAGGLVVLAAADVERRDGDDQVGR